jgi:hypothetical protein
MTKMQIRKMSPRETTILMFTYGKKFTQETQIKQKNQAVHIIDLTSDIPTNKKERTITKNSTTS